METVEALAYEPSLIAGEIEIAKNDSSEIIMRIVDKNIDEARYNDCWAHMNEDEKQFGKKYDFNVDKEAGWADERLTQCINVALLPALERCRNDISQGNTEVHIAEDLRGNLMGSEKIVIKPLCLLIAPPPERRAYAFFKLNPIN